MKQAIRAALTFAALAVVVVPAPAQAPPLATAQPAQPGQAASPVPPGVHVLIVGNTLDSGIGEGVKNNVLRLEGILGSFNEARLRVRVDKIAGDDFTCDKLDAALIKLARASKANDTVIFYFAGHGFRVEQATSAFPKLVCGLLPRDSRDFEPIVRRLKQSARLVIAITDSCNNVLSITSRPVGAFQLPPLDQRGRRIRHLMLDYRGILMMAAAKPTQFAYYSATKFSPIEMGHFSRQFLGALSLAIDRNEPEAEWGKIVAEGIKEISIRNDSGAVIDKQQPQAVNELVKIRRPAQ